MNGTDVAEKPTNSWPSWLPLRKDLINLSAYGAPQREVPVKLNTNENPYSVPNDVANDISHHLESVIKDLNRYPDRDAVKLRDGLAKYINGQSGTQFDRTNIWAANGSNEILQSIFMAFGGTSLGFVPSYSVHPLIANALGIAWREGKRAEDFSLDISLAVETISTVKPTLTFITTPNNPTGSHVPRADIKTIADVVKSVNGLLIIDEAYAEFSDEESAVTLIPENPHIIVVRTMSKAFAFAGARVGYAVADPAVINAMYLVRLPYHLSALTQAAAQVALAHSRELLAHVDQIRKDRLTVAQGIRELGLTVVPSQANFLLFSGFTQPAAHLWDELTSHGVLIRDVGLPGYLRVTIGTSDENQRFIDALKISLRK